MDKFKQSQWHFNKGFLHISHGYLSRRNRGKNKDKRLNRSSRRYLKNDTSFEIDFHFESLFRFLSFDDYDDDFFHDSSKDYFRYGEKMHMYKHDGTIEIVY